MPQPTTQEVHFDQVLTQIAVAYIQDTKKFIADRVFPVVNVEKQSDLVLLFDKEAWLRIKAQKRAPGAESAGSGFAIARTEPYFCDIYAFHWDVPLATFKNSDIPNLERQVVETVMYQLLLLREKTWVEKFFDHNGKSIGVNFWNGSSPTVKWDNENSDPIAGIFTAREYIESITGISPNKIVMSVKVYNALRMHPKIQAQLVYAPTAPDVKGLVTPELLARLFDVDEVLVGRALHDTGPEGSALNPTYMFPDNLLLVYAPERPGLMVPTGGYIFAWTGYNNGYNVGVATIELPTRKAIRYEGEMAYDQKLLAPDLGYILYDVLS